MFTKRNGSIHDLPASLFLELNCAFNKEKAEDLGMVIAAGESQSDLT